VAIAKKKRSAVAARRTLTLAEFAKARPTIAAHIAQSSAQWNSHGWGVVGNARALRVEVAVPLTTLNPAAPVGTVKLPRSIGGSLKLAVRSSGQGLIARSALSLPPPGPLAASVSAAVREPFAPGSRILVDSRPVQRAGVACLVSADSQTYLITCGHVFSPNAANTAVFVNGEVVATLTHNFLDDAEQLDAAYCLVTNRGLQLAAQSLNAPTWFGALLTPSAGQGQPAVFWPTNDSATDAVTTTINSFSSCENGLFNSFWNLSLCELVRTELVTTGGDSGSLLSVRDRYYALCSGSPSWSYYTPIEFVLDRMRNTFSEVELWQPV
jgi:hypothetical protein